MPVLIITPARDATYPKESCRYQMPLHTLVRNSTLLILIVKLDCCISHFLKEIKKWLYYQYYFYLLKYSASVWSPGSYHHQWFYEYTESHFQVRSKGKVNRNASPLLKDEGSEIKEPEWCDRIPRDSAKRHLLIRQLQVPDTWAPLWMPAPALCWQDTFWGVQELFDDPDSHCFFSDWSLHLSHSGFCLFFFLNQETLLFSEAPK